MSAPNPTAVQDYFEPQRFLAHVLRQHRVELFDGLTDTASRMEATRAAIQAHRLAEALVPSRGGRPETFASYFARAFGQPLVEATR